jgi:hypothetical protein
LPQFSKIKYYSPTVSSFKVLIKDGLVPLKLWSIWEIQIVLKETKTVICQRDVSADPHVVLLLGGMGGT